MGDFNAKVGKSRAGSVVGEYGVGVRNERGERLIQYCVENNLVLTNTWYKLPQRRLYTWKSPQDNDQRIVRNQIDYIMVNHRFRNLITKATTMPGADIESDHNLLRANISLRLARAKRKNINKTLDPKLLRNIEIQGEYKYSLNNQLSSITAVGDVEECWLKVKHAFTNTNEKLLQSKGLTGKNEWMTQEILDLMEERRQCKINNNSLGYRTLQRNIRNEIRLAKEKWLSERCVEAENLNRLGDSFNLHKKIKEIAGLYKKKPTHILRDENNAIVVDADRMSAIWKEYATSLFNDDRPDNPSLQINCQSGPNILEAEVSHAIKLMKNNKAPGPDNMYSETFHYLDEHNIKTIVKLFNNIYDTGRLPEDWLRSTFITLPKSNNTKTCKDYRLISLMSHFLKLFLRILHTRLYRKCEEASGISQFGFKNGFGTREAIFSLQTLVQNCQDQRQDVFICFIDYEKAFDNVKHHALVSYLEELGLDSKDIRLICNLYWNQKAEIRLNNLTETEQFEIRKGVRQGCILSPMLFNLYAEKVFIDAVLDSPIGIKINGISINNIRYADDTAIIAGSAGGLQTLLDQVNEASRRLGLKINISKTKFMVVSKNNVPHTRIRLDGQDIQQVTQFKYLGCMLNSNWDPDQEIRCRIEQARTTFFRLRKFLTNKNLCFGIRYRTVKCYVWSVLLYGVEAWTLKVTSINKLEAFEMWCLRRMFRISWMDRIRNEEVLRRAELADRELFDTIKHRKISYLGHILRGERYEFQRLILQGKIEGGRRGIGRRKLSWLRNIRQWTGIHNFQELQTAAFNRNI